MDVITIIIIAVAVLILYRTGSLGKTFGFLLKWALYPTLFGIIVGVICTFLLPGIGTVIGSLVGALIGLLFAIGDANRKLKR